MQIDDSVDLVRELEINTRISQIWVFQGQVTIIEREILTF